MTTSRTTLLRLILIALDDLPVPCTLADKQKLEAQIKYTKGG